MSGRPDSGVKHGWESLRERVGVSADHTTSDTPSRLVWLRTASQGPLMLALMGHMSRAMLERYSHIRMSANRDEVAGVTLRQREENSEAVPVKVPVAAQLRRFSDGQFKLSA